MAFMAAMKTVHLCEAFGVQLEIHQGGPATSKFWEQSRFQVSTL